MTKDTDEFSQFTEPVACREYVLPRDENQLTRKVGFEGIPILEVATCCLHGQYGVEIRIESVLKRKFSLMGQNYSWIEQVGHRLKPTKSTTKTSRRLLKRRRKHLR